MTLQDLAQEASVARQILECCSEGSEPWKGLRRPVSPEQCGLGASLLSADSQDFTKAVSENFSTFIPRQLAWHIFRRCYFCSFQKVEMEKEKKKLQIDIIFPQKLF